MFNSSKMSATAAPEVSSAEARWRNYQHLVWTQQQIHLQIQQQQQMQNHTKVHGSSEVSGPHGENSVIHGQVPPQETQEKPVEEQTKDMSDPWDNVEAQTAFLGPSLWDKRLPYDGQDFKLEYVDLEEFLNENGIHMDPMTEFGKNNMPGMPGMHMGPHSSTAFPINSQFMAGPSRGHSSNANLLRNMSAPLHPQPTSSESRSPSPSGSVASSSACSSMSSQDVHTPSTSPDSGEAKMDEQYAHQGNEFDPRTRMFSDEELKPQPMIKKSRKQFVPDEQKDAKYWARRRKNNMAAKRSRDARRVKENQIAMRACYLEKENQMLKAEMERVQKESLMLKEQLNRCHREH